MSTAANERLPEKSAPERITLGVRRGVRPGNKAPVRIYLGTEASQFRPERVLVWSIEQVRDPSRVYEIFVMKELAGFDRRGWTTGFTNYRFAIPHFAGNSGRAIYNDEDQIYLTDPGELFDLEMGGHGALAISETESSVMLIDCARMASVWTLDEARRGRKKALLQRAAQQRLVGGLAPEWNARDGEYREGRSHLLHYTTLHTQPWRPFPERFVYRDHPLAGLWHGLERSADEAGFQLFSRECPSSRFSAVASGSHASPPLDPALAALEELPEASVETWDPRAGKAPAASEAIACSRGLAEIPEDDLPWVLDELFAAAGRFALCAVDCERPAGALRPTETEVATAPERWPQHFAAAGSRHPHVHWELVLRYADGSEIHHHGGPRHREGPPSVWWLAEPTDTATEAARAVGEALGWPLRRVSSRREELEPPWPELVIAAGEAVAETARWIRAQSRGRARVVRLGTGSALPGPGDDLLVTPVSAGGFQHPRRFEIATPLVSIDAAARRKAAHEWSAHFAQASLPTIALLLADDEDGSCALGPDDAAALGRVAGGLVRDAGGSIFALVSASTPERVRAALLEALQAALPGVLRVETLHRGDDAYLAHLEHADAYVVVSAAEHVVADVCTTGRPVHFFTGSRAARGAFARLRAAVAARADAAPANDRGTTRPQQGLERWCSRLIARGVVQRPRQVAALEAALQECSAARRLGEPTPRDGFRRLDEAGRTAARVRELLGEGKRAPAPGDLPPR